MMTYRADGGSEKTAEITVHQTEALYERHNRAPEITAAVYIAEATAAAGYDCEVTYDFPLQDSPTEASGCNSDGQWESGAWSWWKEQEDSLPDDYKGKDGTLLLVDANGGGCTIDGGNMSIAGGKEIHSAHTSYEEEVAITADYPGDWRGRVFAILHEIGHCYGLGHGHGMIWNEWSHGRYVQTPNPPDPGQENACGEVVDTPDSTMDRWVQTTWYSQCASPRMGEVIVEGDDGDNGGGSDPPPGDEPTVTVDVSVGSGSATCEATLHNASIDYWQWQLFDGDGANISYKEGNPVTFDLPGEDDYLAEAIAKTTGGDWIRGEQTFTYDGSGGGGGGGGGTVDVTIDVANLHESNGQIDVMASSSASVSSWEWAVYENGSEVDSNTGNPSELFVDGPGSYIVEVTATAGDGSTGQANTGIEWEANNPPSVSIDVANLHSNNGQIDCLASASADGDKEIASYQWELIDASGSVVDSVSGNNVALYAPDRGEYTVRVTVEDSDGMTASAETDVAWNQPPSVSIDDVSVDDSTGEVSCVASGSDPDGFIDSYQWELVDGGGVTDTDSGQDATLQAPEAGTYDVFVIATDDDGATSEAQTSVSYNPDTGGGGDNQSPSAEITQIDLGAEGNVELAAEGSDPDGQIVSWQWEVLQGGETIDTASGQSATVTVPEEGDYTARVTVEDDLGATASASMGFQYAPGGGFSRAQLAIAAVAALGLWYSQRQG